MRFLKLLVDLFEPMSGVSKEASAGNGGWADFGSSSTEAATTAQEGWADFGSSGSTTDSTAPVTENVVPPETEAAVLLSDGILFGRLYAFNFLIIITAVQLSVTDA